MRNKHLEVRRRIENTKLKITDAELFGSPLYASVLRDLAETATKRYRRKCVVSVYWDESEGAGIACTNNRKIKLNAGNRITASFPHRRLKDLSLRGILGHEIGHILYTDFNMMQLYNAKLRMGEFYPADPAVAEPVEQSHLDEMKEALRDKDPAVLITLVQCGNKLNNIVEDIYIEARMTSAFPGTFAQGIALNSLRMMETAPKLKQQLDRGDYGFSVMCNLMLQYCRSGDVNNLTEEKSKYLDLLYECVPILDNAIYDDDGRVRYDAANLLLVRLWPLLEPIIEQTRERLARGEEAEEALAKALAEQIAGSETASGKGKPSKEADNEEWNEEDTRKKREEAKEVLEKEGDRITLEETDSTQDGTSGETTCDDAYEGGAYERSAADIERVLNRLAEARVCEEQEAELEEELQSEADDIRYGDAHAGVHVVVHRMASVPEDLISRYESVAPPLLRLSRRLQKQVLQVLKDRRRGGRETDLLMGHRLLARSLYHEDGRIFYKNRLPQDRTELAVGLLVDESGSMCCNDRITKARAAAIVVYDFCKALKIPILVQGHSEGGKIVDMYSYAEFDSRDGNDHYRLMDLSAREGNRDGAALRYVGERLARRPEEIRLLIIISDGQPAATGYYGTAAEADLRGIKREFTNRGIDIFAAAIGEDKENIERIYGDGFLDISNLDDLPGNLTRLIADRIKKVGA